MAKSDDLLRGALTENHGSQSSNNRGNRSDVELTIDPLLSDRKPFGKSCHPNVYPPLEAEEPEKDDKAEGDHSKLEQLTRDLTKAQAKGRKWKARTRELQEKFEEEEKFRVLRQASSDFMKTPEGKLVDKHLMKKACDMFPDDFPQEYCKSYKREFNIQMFLSNNRKKFSTDPEAVKKRLSSLCSKNGKVNEKEVIWRTSSVANSDVALSNLKSAASELVLQEEEKRKLKWHWDKPKLQKYYYLCKAAAIGNEKAHCFVDSPEWNVNGLADSGELTFEDENLGDLVKDIVKLGNSDAHHKHLDLRASPPHPPARPLRAGPRSGGRGPWADMPGSMPSANRREPHYTADLDAEWPLLNSNAGLQRPTPPSQRSDEWRAALLSPPPCSGPTGLGRGGPLHLPATRRAV